MSRVRGPMELREVQGWRTPPPLVDIPIFGLAGWSGPQWMLLYDGNRVFDGRQETGLRLVELAFGEVGWPPDPRRWTDVTTYAKLPASRNAAGGTVATSLAEVGSGALIMLTDRAVAHLPERGRSRKALRHDLNRQLTTSGAVTFRSDRLPDNWWSPVPITVDGLPVAAFNAELAGSWALAADVGPVFVALKGSGERPALLALETVRDLRLFPMPGLDD